MLSYWERELDFLRGLLHGPGQQAPVLKHVGFLTFIFRIKKSQSSLGSKTIFLKVFLFFKADEMNHNASGNIIYLITIKIEMELNKILNWPLKWQRSDKQHVSCSLMASSSICFIDTKFEGGKTSSFHSANPVVPVHTLNKKTYFIIELFKMILLQMNTRKNGIKVL